MKCRDFQKDIPRIIKKQIPVEDMAELIEHVENCKDCYDELETYYVIQYGLSDDDYDESMDFVGRLEQNLVRMKKKARNFDIARAIYGFINISAFTAIGGTLIYVIFKYFVK